MIGHLGEGEGAGAVDDDAGFVVDGDAGEGGDGGAGGDDDVFCRHDFGAPALVRDIDAVWGLEGGVALEPVDLVLFEQEFDAAGQFLHRRRLLAHQHGQVERDAGGHNAKLGHRAVGGFFEEFAAVEQRLGGDAADVEAGAAQCGAAFGAGDLQAKLRGADGRDIAAGAGTDDEDVVVIISHGCGPPQRSISSRVGSSIASLIVFSAVTASRPSIRR